MYVGILGLPTVLDFGRSLGAFHASTPRSSALEVARSIAIYLRAVIPEPVSGNFALLRLVGLGAACALWKLAQGKRSSRMNRHEGAIDLSNVCRVGMFATSTMLS